MTYFVNRQTLYYSIGMTQCSSSAFI